MNYNLTIAWLYPDLMSIYGDRGNIISLTRRCEWRGIGVQVNPIYLDTQLTHLQTADLLFMGGAQDRQQTIVADDLQKKKHLLAEMIENNTPGLYICGGFQYLGKYYKEADGTKIEQLGILDVWTENPGGKRLIGNIAIEADGSLLMVNGKSTINHKLSTINPILVGFENHGGRTRLGPMVKPLGKVVKGFGSNAEDHTEGAIYKNSIGTYLHGPLLPKNPLLADWLIQKALERKYQEEINLKQLDDTVAQKAHDSVLSKLHLM